MPPAVALLARELGGPTYSVTIHGPDEFDAPIGLSLADKVGGASFVAAISSYAAAQVRRWIPLDQWDKVHIVRCTVGEQFLGAATPLDPSSITLLCIGRFNAQKGHLQLVEAFAGVIAAESMRSWSWQEMVSCDRKSSLRSRITGLSVMWQSPAGSLSPKCDAGSASVARSSWRVSRRACQWS
jgi:hypothetical protein